MSGLSVVMLGSGTSTGVPVIGCACPVCTSDDPRNRRSRASALLRFADPESRARSVVIDTATDFREQALRERIERVDAVLYTHAHADHLFGLDDLRIYNFRQGGAIRCYGSEQTLERVRNTFSYVFENGPEGGGKPSLELVPVAGSFELCGRTVVPIPVWHGELPVFGYRLGRFAYVTDCSAIPERSMGLLAGLDLLILGALRYREHPTHLSVGEALAAAVAIGARRTVLTHLACEIDSARPRFPLPSSVEFGCDGMAFEVGDD